jgi:hypothetical protein
MYGIYIRVALQIQQIPYLLVCYYMPRNPIFGLNLRGVIWDFCRFFFELIKSLQVMPYEVAGEQFLFLCRMHVFALLLLLVISNHFFSLLGIRKIEVERRRCYWRHVD